jgi:putative transposase
MPRKARLDAPGTLHHVMIRGMDGVEIFREEQDRQAFIDRLSQLVESSQTRILAWVLMANHVHLLLFSGPQGLSQFMRRLLTAYAIYFNRRYERRGHLFQDRYKSIVCEEEAYLLELVRYIHLNPLRAGIVKGLEELNRYKWSGHSVLIGKEKNDWQERGYILRNFHMKLGKAVRAYSNFIKEGMAQGRRLDLVGGGLVRSLGGWSRVLTLRSDPGKVEHDARILGDEEFVSSILREADEKLRKQVVSGKRKGIADQVIREVCVQEEVNELELRGGGQKRRVSQVRARVSYILSREWGIPLAEIARTLGVTTSAIAQAIAGFRSKMKS